MIFGGKSYSIDNLCSFPPFANPEHTTLCGGTGSFLLHAPTIAPITTPPVTGQLLTIQAPITDTFLMPIFGVGLVGDGVGPVNLVLSGPSQALVTFSDFSFGDGSHSWNPQSGVWMLDPVPEPGTLLLLSTAFTALAYVRRRSNRRCHMLRGSAVCRATSADEG
jgi:hypothetical protein